MGLVYTASVHLMAVSTQNKRSGNNQKTARHYDTYVYVFILAWRVDPRCGSALLCYDDRNPGLSGSLPFFHFKIPTTGINDIWNTREKDGDWIALGHNDHHISHFLSAVQHRCVFFFLPSPTFSHTLTRWWETSTPSAFTPFISHQQNSPCKISSVKWKRKNK